MVTGLQMMSPMPMIQELVNIVTGLKIKLVH